jgi:hypothetical protein|tara:strand:- start:13471 stop:14262 length:792 start_codon:yes stop_codon:yes gene_type:complete
MKTTKKLVSKTYRLKGEEAPLCYMLSSHHTKRSSLLYFDEEEGINKPLRYARNQKSPFEDEQDGNAILEPIIFEDGLLHVERQNQILQSFLSIHPSNGTVFEEINEAKDASEELEMEELILDAQVLARELSIEKLITISRVLLGSNVDKLSTAELKRDILVFSRNEPIGFLDMLDDPSLQVYDDVAQFFSNGMLMLKNNQRDVYFNLPTNKTKFLTVPYGEDPNDIVSSYMQTDDGIETYKLLNKHLKAPSKPTKKQKVKDTE